MIKSAVIETSIPGSKCAWCGKILRRPEGFSDETNMMIWSHGICPACVRRVRLSLRSADRVPIRVMN